MPGSVIGAPDWELQLGDYVTVVAASPDGELVACGSLAGDAVLVEARSANAIAKLVDHPFGVLSAAWSPDGSTLAVGGHDGIVRRYGRDGRTLGVLTVGGWVAGLAWSPDGAVLGVAGDRALTLVRSDGTVLRRCADVDSTITDLAWSPNGKRIGVTCYGGVSWYDPAADSAEPAKVHAWKGSLLSLAVSPTGRWACAGAQDNSIHLWRLWSGDDLSMSGYPAKIEHIAFRSDGRWMASACLGEITVWDFGGRGPSGTRPASAELHRRHVSAMCWQPGGDVLASGGADGQVVLWPSPRRQGQALDPLSLVTDEADVSTITWRSPRRLLIGRADGRVEARRVAASIG